MYAVRDIMHCKPGKVREMVDKFRKLNAVMQAEGQTPFRILTDVSGEPFWTVAVISETDSIDAFFADMDKAMANEEVRRIMAGYHDLVVSGRREIYKIEA